MAPTGSSKTDNSPFLECPPLFMLVKMRGKPSQKQDIVACNHQTLSSCRIIANLSKLRRQTALQCAFNKGCYCCGDAQSIRGCGQPRMSREALKGLSGPRLPSDACPVIRGRGATSQHRKLFAVHGAWAGNLLIQYITIHFENIRKGKAFIKKSK